ncbi:MAG TPA: M3 family metallopeptidase [Candidatus Saccharimonadales bacterium]
MTNSFFHPTHEVHFDRYKPEDVAAALEHSEKLAWERYDALMKIPAKDRTFENTVLAFTRAADEFGTVLSIVGTLDSLIGGEWNMPYEEAVKVSSRLHSKVQVHEGLFGALKEYADAHLDALPPNRKKLVTEMIRDYKRSGIMLPKPKKEKLTALRLKLSEATTEFGQNVVKANDKAGLHITDRSQLAGLDESLIDTAHKAAKKKKLSGYWIAYNEPNYVAVMTRCEVRETRKAFHKVSNTRAADKNAPLAKNILALRQEIAELLGYKDYADYVLENRMIKTGQRAKDFIAELTARYKPASIKEHASLLAFARKFENDPNFGLDITDIDSGLHFYYAEKQRQQDHGINEQKVKEYFPIENVIKGMFDTLGTLYGIRFRPNTQKTWHKDVMSYDLIDENDRHIASVWCDWFTRPGKRGGAWMNDFYAAERTGSASDRPHLGYVAANFDPPTKDTPSLLTIHDVETVWHEFGHFMHFALGKTELPEQSMLECLWDFIEAPSQIMENWVWQPEIITRMAQHYKTGEVLPQATLEALTAARTFRVAASAMRQLYFATVDLALHTEFDGSRDVLEYTREIKKDFVPLSVAPYEASIASFSHIFAGGYAAAYYSYKWAETIEADLFSRFKKEGILSPATGRAYAAEVLARGDEELPEVLIRNFLGRDVDMTAMLVRDGISQGTQ